MRYGVVLALALLLSGCGTQAAPAEDPVVTETWVSCPIDPATEQPQQSC